MRPGGIEEARRFRQVVDESTPVLGDLETVLDLAEDGRIDDPESRAACESLRDVLSEALT